MARSLGALLLEEIFKAKLPPEELQRVLELSNLESWTNEEWTELKRLYHHRVLGDTGYLG